VTNFRDNSLFVFDLDQGVVGEQVAYAPFLGENPHVIRVAPDGMTAVIANYTGDLYDKLSSSPLVVIDLDPASETFLKPLTWIANR
jgi:DNA-binding beta-propeller fold protein YncE